MPDVERLEIEHFLDYSRFSGACIDSRNFTIFSLTPSVVNVHLTVYRQEAECINKAFSQIGT